MTNPARHLSVASAHCAPGFAAASHGTSIAIDTGMETRSDFRYVDADRLDTSAGRLDDVVVVNPSNRPLGKLDGVIVDPAQRQVRYYVVESSGWFSSHHYLLPLRPARLLRDRRAIEIDIDTDEMKRLPRVDPDRLPHLSDDDVITAMFHAPAA